MFIYPLLTINVIRDRYDGLKVRVFISGSNGRWAVQGYDTSQTLFNTNHLTLVDVTTYIDQLKRLQCVKHVRPTHAYVVGTIGSIDKDRKYKRIDYDPHARDCFFWVHDNIQFVSADYACCNERYVFASTWSEAFGSR